MVGQRVQIVSDDIERDAEEMFGEFEERVERFSGYVGETGTVVEMFGDVHVCARVMFQDEWVLPFPIKNIKVL